MEDPRISRMYFSLVSRWLSKARTAVMRSGILTLLALAIGLVFLAWIWKQHQQGSFARLKAGLKKPAPSLSSMLVRPGGQDPIVIERTQIEASNMPQFLKATLLPGRGMNLFQITAYLPQKGAVQLLDSPSLETAAGQFTGTGSDATGAISLAAGGAFEAPWSGRLFGHPSPDKKTLRASWDGRTLNVPVAIPSVPPSAMGGLLLKRSSTSSATHVMPDGGEAQAVFDAADFDGHWLSNTKVTTTIQLNSRAIEIKIVAQNTGDEPEPVGLGWQPRFAILAPDRTSVTLRLPSEAKTEVNPNNGIPTGKLSPLTAEEREFASNSGAPLGNLTLNDTYVHLRQTPLDNGPIVELRDLHNNYGLRITTLSPSIKALHVYAPADGQFISIGPRFNYDDPFGREWSSSEGSGMVTIAPGRSVEWRIRLEIFSLTATEP